MRLGLTAAVAALLLVIVSSCVPQQSESKTGHPDLIIVREFTFSPGVVTLDPSFGFSLNRGSPGVPTRQRAESIARAAAFNIADTVTQRLTSLGYDVVQSSEAAAQRGGRALIVTGRFQRIDEGHRRHVGSENASVVVDTEIDMQPGGGAAVRLMNFQLDSRRVPRGTAGGRGASVNAAATRVGNALAHTVSETAQLNRWPATGR